MPVPAAFSRRPVHPTLSAHHSSWRAVDHRRRVQGVAACGEPGVNIPGTREGVETQPYHSYASDARGATANTSAFHRRSDRQSEWSRPPGQPRHPPYPPASLNGEPPTEELQTTSRARLGAGGVGEDDHPGFPAGDDLIATVAEHIRDLIVEVVRSRCGPVGPVERRMGLRQRRRIRKLGQDHRLALRVDRRPPLTKRRIEIPNLDTVRAAADQLLATVAENLDRTGSSNTDPGSSNPGVAPLRQRERRTAGPNTDGFAAGHRLSAAAEDAIPSTPRTATTNKHPRPRQSTPHRLTTEQTPTTRTPNARKLNAKYDRCRVTSQGYSQNHPAVIRTFPSPSSRRAAASLGQPRRRGSARSSALA